MDVAQESEDELMDREDLADLLARWALWVAGGNRAGLGYAMVGYAERVGSAFSVDDSPPPIDPAILRIDECIRRLPPEHRQIIVVHYTRPGTAKSKQAMLDVTKDRYYELLDHGQAFLAHMMGEVVA